MAARTYPSEREPGGDLIDPRRLITLRQLSPTFWQGPRARSRWLFIILFDGHPAKAQFYSETQGAPYAVIESQYPLYVFNHNDRFRLRQMRHRETDRMWNNMPAGLSLINRMNYLEVERL